MTQPPKETGSTIAPPPEPALPQCSSPSLSGATGRAVPEWSDPVNGRDSACDWSAKGAIFLTPPIDRGPEIRCYMRDPDGHLIEVGQATPVL